MGYGNISHKIYFVFRLWVSQALDSLYFSKYIFHNVTANELCCNLTVDI